MGAGRDGLCLGILDDVLLIDHIINYMPDCTQICCWASWAQILIAKNVLYYILCIYIKFNGLFRYWQVRLNRCSRMGSDDDIPIRQVLPIGTQFCLWAWFSIGKNCVLQYIYMNYTSFYSSRDAGMGS